MPSISYAITACNEHVELEKLLNQLQSTIRNEDEIVLQLDLTATPEVRSVAKEYSSIINIQLDYPLNNDFAAFKNNLSSFCAKDYVFQIDADEYLHPWLAENLHLVLEDNPNTDVFLVPRINIVEGLTKEHISKWMWRVDDNGWVNFPDFQWRIWKNSKNITWKNKVHEILTNYGSYSNLPAMEECCLIHIKDIARQEKQNEFYSKL